MNNDDLKKMINDFKSSDKDNNTKVNELMKNLNDAQTKQVQDILNDPQKSQEILNSPAAQALLKRLMK